MAPVVIWVGASSSKFVFSIMGSVSFPFLYVKIFGIEFYLESSLIENIKSFSLGCRTEEVVTFAVMAVVVEAAIGMAAIVVKAEKDMKLAWEKHPRHFAYGGRTKYHRQPGA